MSRQDERNEPSSPVCYMSEFADELLPAPGKDGPDWPTVRAFRKAKRAELLARREALTLDERKRAAESVVAQLERAVDLGRYPVLGFYWPIRGELDLRDVARRHVESGGTAALPVVVEKNAPVEFWEWQHGAPMRRGFWNIPVPAERRVVLPDVLLIPLVGYDAAGYRLGYGGGYYDRLLIELGPSTPRVAAAFEVQVVDALPVAEHDQRVHQVVTEQRILPA